jgi:phosphatidylinositol-3-phosphatase
MEMLTLLQRRSAQVVISLAICSLLLAGCAGGTNSLTGVTTPLPNGVLPNFAHVFVIMLENRGYEQIMGNTHAPYLNHLAITAGLATKYTGVAHPSQPNYLAAISGGTFGVQDDNDVTLHVPNLVDQLEEHGRTWKAYMQSINQCASPLDSFCGNDRYARKHNPFVSFADIQSNPSRMKLIVDTSALAPDLASGQVANFVWISPDQCHDMHGLALPASDPCSGDNPDALTAQGDAFTQTTVDAIMSSSAWSSAAEPSVIFVTWDESEGASEDNAGCCGIDSGGGHVVMIAISKASPGARTSTVAYNHYSLLATIQQSWGLGCLEATCNTAEVHPLTDLVSRATTTAPVTSHAVVPGLLVSQHSP